MLPKTEHGAELVYLPFDFVAACGGPASEIFTATFRTHPLIRVGYEWLLKNLESAPDQLFSETAHFKSDEISKALNGGTKIRLELEIRQPSTYRSLSEQVPAPKQSTTSSQVLDFQAAYLQKRLQLECGFQFASVVIKPYRDNALAEWAETFFPSLSSEMGNLKFLDSIERLRGELPGVELAPWTELGYLPGYLRRERFGAHLTEIAASDWARFSTLFNPQDEISEELSLAPSEVMLNPSVQVLGLSESAKMIAFVRRRAPSWTVEEFAVDWRQALVLDELTESGRVEKSHLISHLNEICLSKAPAANLSKSDVMPLMVSAVNELINANVILSRSES